MRRALFFVAAAIVIGVVVFVVSRPSGEQRYGASGIVLESRAHGPEFCLGGILESYPPQCGGLPLVGWDWDDVDNEESASGTKWVGVYLEGTYDGERFTLTAPPRPPKRERTEDPSFEPACDEPKALDGSLGIAEWEEATQAAGNALNELPNLVAVWVTESPFTANVIVRPGARAEAEEIIREHWRGNLCLVERDQKTTRELDAIMERLDNVLTQDVLTAAPNYQRGVVEVTITVVDDVARSEVDDAFGEGVVELTGELRPV